jgi:hypothetical protein
MDFGKGKIDHRISDFGYVSRHRGGVAVRASKWGSAVNAKLRASLLSLIPAAGLVAVLVAWRTAEFLWLPVVTHFVVHQVDRQPDKVIISGTLHKARDCKFESVTAYGVTADDERKRLPILFLDSNGDDGATRPLGKQKWGPWRITLPVKPGVVAIELKSLHSCHWLWAQQTHLGDVPLIYRGDTP